MTLQKKSFPLTLSPIFKNSLSIPTLKNIHTHSKLQHNPTASCSMTLQARLQARLRQARRIGHGWHAGHTPSGLVTTKSCIYYWTHIWHFCVHFTHVKNVSFLSKYLCIIYS